MIDNSKLVIGNVTFGPAPKTVVTGGHTPTPAALTEQRVREEIAKHEYGVGHMQPPVPLGGQG